MSEHAHTPSKPADINIPPGSLWAKLPMAGGITAFVALAVVLGSAGGENRARSMFSYLWAYEFGLSIALGALGYVLIEHVVRSAWSTVIRRVGETAAMTLPLFAVLWIPIGTLGFHSLYPWSHEMDEVLQRKRWFLNDGFFFTRAVIYLAIWCGLAWFFHRTSTKQDNESDPAAREALTRRMWKMAAPGLFLWAFSISFAAIDWVMSLQPHWYSTIFGVYFFAGAIGSFYAFTVLVTIGLQKAGVLKEAVTTEHFHDLGKFMFGYTIFWAYIAFSQFVLIWYANIPEETIFYMVRVENGWKTISYALPVLHFAVPFFYLLSRHVKRNRKFLAIGAAWMIALQMLDLYWIILPNFGTHGPEAKEAYYEPNLIDCVALVGVVAGFFAVFSYFLKRNKVIAINDPRLAESLAHENF